MSVLSLAPAAAGLAQQGSAMTSITAPLPDAPSFLLAQSVQAAARKGTATASGLISDVNGGIVPGAVIQAIDANGQSAGEATADSEGHFEITGLVAGKYTFKVHATGLQSFEWPVIELKDNEQYALTTTALPIAGSSQSVDVFLTRSQIADEEIKDETHQRVLGILPNFYTSYVWDAAPLNARQKFKLAWRTAIDPWVFIRTGITAGIQQANNTDPDFGGGGSGFAKRYASAYGTAITGRFIGSALLSSVFHQDPRYFYRGTGGVGRRTVHALVSAVAARTDNGHIEPSYTHILGDFATGYISRSWRPDSNNGLGLAFQEVGWGIGDAAVRNLFQEFFFKRISRGTPPLAKGKPPQEKESAAHP